MKTLTIEGPPAVIQTTLGLTDMPPLPAVKRQLLDYQLLALWHLARQYDRPGARLLEIGTGQGGSSYMLAKAAPAARVLSLTVASAEAEAAAAFWRREGLPNVDAKVSASWGYLEALPKGDRFDLVFVDGDHNRIARDLPWFARLRVGGLLLCHDYSPQDSAAPSAIVFAELNRMAERLGRPFDVLIVDRDKIGMAGFYRRRGDAL